MRYYCFLFVLLFSVQSCKNYYNEAIDWMDSIPKDSHISTVREIQPSFLEIDWKNPVTIDSIKTYSVMSIKNSNDVLKMSNQLVFINDKFVMRISKK